MKLFGFIGIALVQLSLLPQLIKLYWMYKDKVQPVEISEAFYWMLTTGLLSFLIYSIYIQDTVYIVSNSIGIGQAGLGLYLVKKMKALFSPKNLG